MLFDLHKSIEILDRTPGTIHHMLHGLSDDWTFSNEGPDTWSPHQVLGHLIFGEKTDWIPRMEMILSKTKEPFPAFDHDNQFEESIGKSMDELLAEFHTLRAANLAKVKNTNLQEEQLNLAGVHPTFGEVTLRQMLATWAVHDLNHMVQVSRVMAWQYQEAVGSWSQFLGVLNTK